MRPIKIVKVKGGYHLFVNNVPIVKDHVGKGITFNLILAGLPPKKSGYVPPINTEPFLIKKMDEVKHLAHHICRYMLNSGDMVFAHTEVVGIENVEAWWNRH